LAFVMAGVRNARVQRRARWAVALGFVAMAAAACASSPPGPPSASAGTTETRAIPATISHEPLTDQHGKTVTLASFRGKIVMVVPFLTLCTDICPLTTGNLLQVEQSLRGAHVADKVQIIELSVDPDRDTPARLAAYAHVTMADWELVTETPTVLRSVSQFFGFEYQKVPEGSPPSIDWLTGKPLTYDVDHSDGYVLIGSTGTQRYSTGAAPNFHGTLTPTMYSFLDEEGLDHLAHPAPTSWTPADALTSLGWLLGQPVPVRTS
jgi:protein SCO1